MLGEFLEVILKNCGQWNIYNKYFKDGEAQADDVVQSGYLKGDGGEG